MEASTIRINAIKYPEGYLVKKANDKIDSIDLNFSIAKAYEMNLFKDEFEKGKNDMFVIMRKSDHEALVKRSRRSKNPLIAEFEEF